MWAPAFGIWCQLTGRRGCPITGDTTIDLMRKMSFVGDWTVRPGKQTQPRLGGSLWMLIFIALSGTFSETWCLPFPVVEACTSQVLTLE